VNECGLHFVLQMNPESCYKNKPLEFRLSKEASLANRINPQDAEKNSSTKKDGRHSSPMVGNKQTYIPLSTNVTEMFGSAPKYGRESLSLGTFTELPNYLSTKNKSRAGYHSANPNNNCENTHPSKDNLNFLRQLSRLEPGIDVVRRTVEEKAASPDKLPCPIIEGEEQPRLLYFQHNFITRIRKLSSLHHLIFLDLYDNQIDEISGLSSLRALCVLMLGKNRIQKISNLENLKNLDVLDLHGNQITKIENVSHLRELRVLNLARNQIKQRDVDTLPSLQLLYLSFNKISRINDILCLADSTSLSDVALDGNPIAQESWEEERRTASVLARKEDEKKRESHKQALIKEKRRMAICNAARQWDIQQNRATSATLDQENGDCVNSYHKQCQLNGTTAFELTEEQRTLDTVLSSAVQGLSVIESHLVEVEGDVLFLYGSGALDSLDRSWSVQTSGSVSTITFTFINFDEIVQVLPKLRIKFPNISHLKFKETNLITLHQFNALAQLRRLDQLTVEPQGNPVVNFTLWKYYVLFRLNSFGIQKINESEVTQNDIVLSEKLFGILAYIASSELPQYRLLALFEESRKKPFRQQLEGKSKKNPAAGEEMNDNRRVLGESPSRTTLNYIPQDLLNEKLEEIKEKKTFCHSYVQDLVNEAADISLKNESLQKLWPQMFIELVRDAVIGVRDKNSYMKQCLQDL
ncbi:hypothetical protein XELAEV_18020687mg, partial [Xenopus laevis]